MKKLAKIFTVVVIVLIFFACGGGGGGTEDEEVISPPVETVVPEPVSPAPGPEPVVAPTAPTPTVPEAPVVPETPPTTPDSSTTTGDCRVKAVSQISDTGLMGRFELTLNFESKLPDSGQNFLEGQEWPDGKWISHNINDKGILILDWPNGRPFEFSYGKIQTDGTKNWIDPSCSAHRFPTGASPADQHLKIVLGPVKSCANLNTGDALIPAIYNLGGNVHRMYVDFSKLPIKGYRKIAISGQSAPGKGWVDYAVVDAFPCFYADISFPPDSTFEFSFYVDKENGEREWINPLLSEKFRCGDHLCAKL